MFSFAPMKKLTLCLGLVAGMVSMLLAQTDEKARLILAEVSKKYRSYDVIKTEFSYTLDNPQAKIKETQTGTLYSKTKLNKFKVILKAQELISDGKNQWTYLKADKEVQLSEVDNSADALNPAKLFTIYEKGFKYLFVGDTKSAAGRLVHNIELTPLDAKRTFFKVKLQIDKATKNISQAVIFDKNGNRYTYTIKSFNSALKVADNFFVFDSKKYPGVELVDLR